jgi:glycerol-3-phosphate acyltransferase PlsY
MIMLQEVVQFPLVPALVAYLIGSVSFAIVWSKVFRLADPRSYGSHNPGATNVLRSGHKVAALLTLLGDGAKGWLAVWLVKTFGTQFGWGEWSVGLSALAVFLGHVFPVYHHFQGGKGVATALGIVIAISGWLALGTVASFAMILFFFRYVSLASIIAAVFAAFYYVLLYALDPIALAIGIMAVLLIWRHKENIARLLAGKESRFGHKASVSPAHGHKH